MKNQTAGVDVVGEQGPVSAPGLEAFFSELFKEVSPQEQQKRLGQVFVRYVKDHQEVEHGEQAPLDFKALFGNFKPWLTEKLKDSSIKKTDARPLLAFVKNGGIGRLVCLKAYYEMMGLDSGYLIRQSGTEQKHGKKYLGHARHALFIAAIIGGLSVGANAMFAEAMFDVSTIVGALGIAGIIISAIYVVVFVADLSIAINSRDKAKQIQTLSKLVILDNQQQGLSAGVPLEQRVQAHALIHELSEGAQQTQFLDFNNVQIHGNNVNSHQGNCYDAGPSGSVSLSSGAAPIAYAVSPLPQSGTNSGGQQPTVDRSTIHAGP